MRIFLDANILFSAASAETLMGKFVRVAISVAEGLSSRYAIEEARRNLVRVFPKRLGEFEELCDQLTFIELTATTLEVVIREKDRPILAAAIAGRATHLLTGDLRDFGPYIGKTIQGVKIVTRELLAKELQ